MLDHASSMFAPDKGRFGKYGDGLPGPGWYDVGGAAARSRRRTALSSSFVSKTERKFLPKGSDAPGPAYYAPRRNRDSSFVLNDTGRWV